MPIFGPAGPLRRQVCTDGQGGSVEGGEGCYQGGYFEYIIFATTNHYIRAYLRPAAGKSHDYMLICGRLRKDHMITCLSAAAGGEITRLRAYLRPPAKRSRGDVPICGRLRGDHTNTCISAAACGEIARLRAYLRPPAGRAHDRSHDYVPRPGCFGPFITNAIFS